MQDFAAYRGKAIRYWELRRIVYNVLLVPPAALGYMLMAGVARAGDDYGWHPYFVGLLVAASAFAANVCYSLAYALEFLFGSDDPESCWLQGVRTGTFVAGVLFSMFLALVGGRNIALMEFQYK